MVRKFDERKKVTKRKQVKRHTNETIIKAAYLYAASGNLSQVSRDTGIKRQSLQNFINSSELWATTCEKARHEISEEILAQNLNAARLSGEALEDRITNGDQVLTKDGLVTVPMKGRDLAVVNGIQIDKGRVSMGLATSVTGSTGTDSAIAALVESFKKVSRENRDITAIKTTYAEVEKDNEK